MKTLKDMTRNAKSTVIASFVFAFLCTGTAHARIDEAEFERIPGHIMIRTDNSDAIDSIVAKLNQLLNVTNTTAVLTVPELDLYTIYHAIPTSTGDQDDIDQMLNDEQDDNSILWSEPERRIDPADGQTGSIWVTGPGIGASLFDSQYAISLLHVPVAQAKTQGQGVLVAMLDTGVD